MEVAIKEMDTKGIYSVMEIEKKSFLSPWSKSLFFRELQTKWSHSFIAQVKNKEEDKIAGYICTWIIQDECDILKLASHNIYRRQGIASALLNYGMREACKRGVKFFLLEVRPSNVAALSLYGKFGFVPVGVRKGYYKETDEDAILMAFQVNSHPRCGIFSF